MANKKGKSLTEFNEKFGSEAACEEHLLNLEKKEGLMCPNAEESHFTTSAAVRFFNVSNAVLKCR